MLGSFVILYLFLGGCGAAALLSTAAWSLVFHRTSSRTFRQTCAFDGLLARLYGIALIAMALGALCLFLDLGQPRLAFLLFTRPTPSLLSVGTFILAAALLVAALLTAAHGLHLSWPPAPVRKALEVLGIIVGLAMLVYTGLYMAWMQAVPLWNNAALPVLLALSSLSSGLSLVLVAVPFGRDWTQVRGWTLGLHRVHRWVLVLEILSLAVFLVLVAFDPFARPALCMLVDPAAMGSWFWVGFFALGLVVPLAAELLLAGARRTGSLAASELMCVGGGLILRFCLVLCGLG